MTRNDVHSPVNLITEDYEYVYALNTNPAEGEWQDPAPKEHESGIDHCLSNWNGHCAHCGARPTWIAILLHKPTGEYIAVGFTCLDNRFSRATDDFRRLKKAAELDRQLQRVKQARLAWVAAHPDLAWMNDSHNIGIPETSLRNTFVQDVARRFRQYGEISEKQEAAVRASLAKDVEWAEKQEAERVARHDPEPAPVVIGRIQVTGRVLTVKEVENQFGWTTKMLVLDDRGFKVYGTRPSGLSAERGVRVTFIATTEQSKDDPTFGFYSRPTKAQVLP